ncbi:MAG: xanthine dehydrogenase family protein molybdopterin-binding subunit [Myxococcaceae bacterium]|jgi:isoquinoline 1-oxidoreductase beta subunit|nr:xanthine dehydrogenase family protein molybdopterin-binding subunit [Myxococcaceae bacterium]MCA3010803.1 xanthine dehydrogenase family protein molybdopterin-binding subunit [Myxococcaceae bacterium]
MKLSRRALIKSGVAVGGGLAVAVWLTTERGKGSAELFAPNAYVRVPSSGPIRVVVGRVEMGQGTATATAMLLAEELEVDPATLVLELADADRAYDNPTLGFQLTGGSSSTVTSWEPVRHAGAAARELLKEAAARRWGVTRAELTAKLGEVLHPPTNRVARYGELVADAATITIHTPKLKAAKDFSVIGKPLPRVDAVEKTNGAAVFGLDVQVPGALVAVLARCPVMGGAVKSLDDAAAKAMPGVTHVVRVPQGVAVVAKTYWHARQAASALVVEWDEGPLATFSSATLRDTHRTLMQDASKRTRVRDDGKADEVLTASATALSAEYFAPFLAHAPMEPQNATAHVTATRCEVWAPTQGPGLAREVAARVTGLPIDQVVIHQTFLGGGFGRRIGQDYVAEAVEVSKAIGAPVKVVWSREDDLRHSFYRPAATHALTASLEGGEVKAWRHHVCTQSVMLQVLDSFLSGLAPKLPTSVKQGVADVAKKVVPGRDATSYEGADSVAYEVPHLAVDFTRHEPPVPTGFWRSVGHSHTAFATESFVDECAWALGRDPVALRRAMLTKRPKHLAVLERVTEAAGWSTPPPEGRARGVAVHECFGTVVACVVEVGLVDDAIRVHRVVLAADCGQVVNPDMVRAQLEGGAIFGLSAALKQRVTFEQGRVQQSNFHDFPPLRLHESPRIEAFVMTSDAPPSGIGEPAVPVMAPAVANAVYALTKKRLRALPLELSEAT